LNELTLTQKDGVLVADSRDIAMMIGTRHSDLLEKINVYIEHLTNGKFRSLDFFIQSSYADKKRTSID